MRITGGQSKGRLLSTLKGLNIRPSSDKVRETIFNLLGQDVSGMKVLDLFAGTGSLGIEALSRGALSALFIDNSRQAVQLIRKNLTLCGYESSCSVLKRDLIRGLPYGHSLIKNRVDLVFIDPPYGKELIPPILRRLSEKEVLSPSSIVVAESSKNDQLPSIFAKLRLIDTRIYGETKIDIYNFKDSE